MAAYRQTLHFDRAVSRRSTGRGATDPELMMIGRSDPRLLFVEHQDVLELDTFRCGPFGFQGQRLAVLGHRTAAVWTALPAFFNENLAVLLSTCVTALLSASGLPVTG
jgi:hypothetical protein